MILIRATLTLVARSPGCLPASGNCLQPGAEHVGECSRQATKVGWHACASLKLTMPLVRLGFGCASWATSLRCSIRLGRGGVLRACRPYCRLSECGWKKIKSARWHNFRSLIDCVLLSRPYCTTNWRNAGPHGKWPASICELHDEICAGPGGLCGRFRRLRDASVCSV